MNTHFYTADLGELDAAQNNEGATLETNCGYVFAFPVTATVPLYRASLTNTPAHLYTTYIDERDDATNDGAYTAEGIACFCYPVLGTPGTVPVYRAYNAATRDHFYTLNADEIQAASPAYVPEGIACYVLKEQSGVSKPLYRLRDKKGFHLYTISPQERQDNLNAGAADEDNCGFVFASPLPGPVPLFRTYDPTDGTHLYTTDIAERDKATNTLGVRGDGITCYLYPDGQQPQNGSALYRAYNATSNDHFYTIDKREYDTVTAPGSAYTGEGITGWVLNTPVNTPTQTATTLYRLLGEFVQDFLIEPPAGGLGSSTNYIFNSIVGAGCNPILGLSVSIELDEAITCIANGPPVPGQAATQGFGFQLNAYSPIGSKCGWQQYCLSLQEGTLYGCVDNWLGDANSASIIQYDFLLNLGALTIPAGYKLTFDLQNDANENITGVTYSVHDAKNKRIATFTRTIASIANFQTVGVAPIVGFELNLVGPSSGESAVLTPASGVFAYSAKSPLLASSGAPPCTEDPLVGTGETANSFYGRVSASRNFKFTQTFNTSNAAQMLPRKEKFVILAGKTRPPLKAFSH